uniref:NADH-ubiquinone oxidoreductase chain 6 n=1 Tax=Pterocladia lucida TaxID=31408 RepID=A0A6M3WWD8_PTELU|nr:Nad6 [Pterocladia lucida]
MSIEASLHLLFSVFALLSAIMVISLTNAVHAVLFLILVFCNIAGLMLLLGAEFIAFMLLIVYVGAIAVLFLFVVMMLNIKVNYFNFNWISIIPLGILIALTMNYQFNFIIREFYLFKTYYDEPNIIYWITEVGNISNVKVIGRVLYTEFGLLFIVSSLILLVAMLGAIVLTMHQRTNVKKQKIEIQLVREPSGVVKFINLRR